MYKDGMSHTGLACSRMVSLRVHHFMDDSPLFGTSLGAKGCKGDLLCGRERSALVSRPFRCSASTARLESSLSLGFGLFWCFYSPSSSCVSFPFNDDLGTRHTWRPYSGKKQSNLATTSFEIAST